MYFMSSKRADHPEGNPKAICLRRALSGESSRNTRDSRPPRRYLVAGFVGNNFSNPFPSPPPVPDVTAAAAAGPGGDGIRRVGGGGFPERDASLRGRLLLQVLQGMMACVCVLRNAAQRSNPGVHATTARTVVTASSRVSHFLLSCTWYRCTTAARTGEPSNNRVSGGIHDIRSPLAAVVSPMLELPSHRQYCCPNRRVKDQALNNSVRAGTLDAHVCMDSMYHVRMYPSFCRKILGKFVGSEGRESDESPGVFATLMFQMPSVVEGGVFTVSDPSSQPPATSLASPSAAAAAGAASRDEAAQSGRSISFSGEKKGCRDG